MKASHLFSRQFLGIGTAAGDSQELADQARVGKNAEPKQTRTAYGPTPFLSRWMGRKLRVGYLSADLATTQWGVPPPILSHHNREKVEMWAISCGSHDDWITDHIRQKLIIGWIYVLEQQRNALAL